jgi:hypothetical protein
LYGELFAAGTRIPWAYEGEGWSAARVSLRGAFFGESTPRSRRPVALVHLFARLRTGGFRLLDAQFRRSTSRGSARWRFRAIRSGCGSPKRLTFKRILELGQLKLL